MKVSNWGTAEPRILPGDELALKVAREVRREFSADHHVTATHHRTRKR
jgi:hypothetical protein